MKNIKRTPTYTSWLKMRERCNNPNGNRSKYYFEKGITYSKEWENFQNFLQDMGERPEKTSLDRIDNNKGYSKENCRWANSTEQARNMSKNVYYLIDGVKYCQEEAREILNVTIKKIRYMREKNTLPENVSFIGKLTTI